jgi:tetratricopeptide (TPR) repeat protein
MDTDIRSPTFHDHEKAATWYEQERTNLVAVARTADDLAMYDIAWQIPAVLRRVYANHNHFDDWITTSTIGLGAARQLDDRQAEAMILGSLGKAYVQSGDRRRGIEFQTAALAVHRDVGDPEGELNSMNAIGLAHLLDHELAEALVYFEQGRGAAIALGNDYWLATLSSNVANVYLDMERFPDAVDLFSAARGTYQRLGFAGSEGEALRGLSQAHRGIGELDESYRLIEQALGIAHRHDNRVWEAFWLVDLGDVQVARGHWEEALTSYHRAATLQRRLGDRSREAGALDAAGQACQKLGRLLEADGFHRVAIAVFRQLGHDWPLALALDNLAITCAATGALAEARVHWQEALTFVSGFADPWAQRIRSRISGTLGMSFG